MDTIRSNEMQRMIESWLKSDEVKASAHTKDYIYNHITILKCCSVANPEETGQPCAWSVGRSGGTELREAASTLSPSPLQLCLSL